MQPEALSLIEGMVGQIAIGILFVFGLIALRIYLFWRRIMRRRYEIERHKDAGTIGPAALIQGASLPWHYDRLAQVGTGGPAALSLNQRILRPSIGVKLVVLGLCAAILYFMFNMPETQHGFEVAEPGVYGWIMQGIILFGALNGILYIFTYETRYDDQALIVTRMMFSRREYRWKDLIRMADDGAYEFHLIFQPGGKAKVLKHSVGIGEFKDFALAQIRKNRSLGL
jgi:hypothetical protein